MSFFSAVKRLPAHLPHGTAHRNFKGVLVDKGERYLAAYAFGAMKGYYRERAVWRGYGADLWLGVGGLLAAGLLQATSGGRSDLAHHLERVGDAGVMSALNSFGAHWGDSKAGVTAAPALPPKKKVVGIDAAQAGPFLSAAEVAQHAQRK